MDTVIIHKTLFEAIIQFSEDPCISTTNMDSNLHLQFYLHRVKVINQFQKLQNKALRIINFKPLRYSVNSLYNKCEILKFGDSIKLPKG